MILGLSPRRTDENTSIGSVVELGPATKLAITTSSSESVKASSQPETSAGAMIGSVIRKNTLIRFAPRSIAASSSDLSSSDRREDTTTVTNARVKVTCAIQMDRMPPGLKPTNSPSDTNISRIDRPMITSGITSGAVISAPNSVLPGKRRMRVITSAAMVPSTTAAVAVQNATLMLIHAARSILSSRNSSPYHLNEKPDQTVARRDSLKEYTIRMNTGTYRKAKPSPSTVQLTARCPTRLMSASLPARAAARG